MIKRIINSKSETITFSAGLIAFSIGVSAILGLLRDRLLVSYFNVEELDIYFAAFAVPDFIYGIIITGGIIAAFLPIFSSTFEKEEGEGWRLANNTLNVLILFLFLFCILFFIFAPNILKLVAPGFSEISLQKTVFLTRIMLMSPLILGISSIFSGILQYFDRFLAYSLAPVLYNIGIIFGIIFLAPHYGLIGLAYGVIIGSLLHLFIQIPSVIFSGFSYKPLINLKQKELKKILYLIVPRIIGQASVKVNIIIITALASLLTAGSISIFNLANHLQSFPVRIIGVAFAVAAFPSFSRLVAAKERKKFLSNFSMVIRQSLFLIIPISVLVFLLRAHIVRLVLGTGEFGWAETKLTAASLGIFSFSFFASCLVLILVRAFFSFQDTRTPLLASLAAMVTNIICCFLFIWALGFDNFFRELVVAVLKLENIANIEVIAFPMAILIATVLQFIILLYLLNFRMGSFRGMGIKESLQKVIFSSVVMGLFSFFTLRLIGKTIILDTFLAVFAQTALTFLVALSVYILMVKITKAPELEAITSSFRGQVKK